MSPKERFVWTGWITSRFQRPNGARVGYLATEPGWWGDTVAEHFLDWSATREIIERLGFAEDCGN